ncbi:hypothetical protein KQX54_001420, partial [Cotesia glomerata]
VPEIRMEFPLIEYILPKCWEFTEVGTKPSKRCISWDPMKHFGKSNLTTYSLFSLSP